MKPLLRAAALCGLIWCGSVGLWAQAGKPPADSGAAARERRAAIDKAIPQLQAECQEFGDGDWSKWYDRLGPFRADLRKRVAAAVARVRFIDGPWDTPTSLIEASGDPPLYESAGDDVYLSEPGNLEAWFKQREAPATIRRFAQWLKARNIELILAPVPKVAEIYPDRVSPYAPSERIVAPQFRKLAFDLLKDDIEVVDLLPRYLAAREEDSAALAFPDDPHWSPRGQQIAVTAILERLQRYQFVKDALAKPPLYHTKPFNGPVKGAWQARAMKPFQIHRIRNYSNWTGAQVLDAKDQPFAAANYSEVTLISDSYGTALNVMMAQGVGFDAHISKGMNLPVATMALPDNTVGSIKDLVRNPDLLRKCKVVVWLVRNSGIAKTEGWSLPPLPAADATLMEQHYLPPEPAAAPQPQRHAQLASIKTGTH
jgi:hypothetical protein